MHKSPTVIFTFLVIVIICNFTCFPAVSLAYNAQTTHPWLTKLSGEMYNSYYQKKLTAQEIQWMMKGSTDEEAGLRRINHFYDPLNNKT